MKTFQETLDFLYQQLPVFHRVGPAAYKEDLTNTILLLEAIGNPHLELKCVHVGGTNGKGTVSSALAALFQTAGYKTGLYTSPHLIHFGERIKINGQFIEDQFVIDFTEKHLNLLETIKPSFFEFTVAMAFQYFKEQNVDIAIIEVGLGGKLDSTNVINPILSIITNISFDHVALLGNTLPEIALQKAGIIKETTPIVIGESNYLTNNVFREVALSKNAPIYFAENHFEVRFLQNLKTKMEVEICIYDEIALKPFLYSKLITDLFGLYQLKNLQTILTSIQILNTLGYNFSKELILEVLGNVKKISGLKGRMDIIQENPLVLVDVAHNEAGIKNLINWLNEQNFNNINIVFGMVKDKDVDKVIELLPKNANYFLCQPNLFRALDVNVLEQKFIENNRTVCFKGTVKEAYLNSLENTDSESITIITGSIFVVGEFYEKLNLF